MQNEENAVIEALIKGGLLGAALGALFSKDKEEGALIGAILGAAVNATHQANEAAQQTNVPVYIEEDGKVFAISPNGHKKFVKNIQKPVISLPEQFKLK